MLSQSGRFAAALGVDPAAVDPGVVAKLAVLDVVRNDIVHRASGSADYERFPDAVVSVVVHVYALAVPTEREIVIHPWEIDQDE